MLELTKVGYQIILVTENGEQAEITYAVLSAGWSENKNELAMRVNITLKNESYNGQDLFSMAKPGCRVGIMAECGGVKQEVARGIIVDWGSTASNSKDVLKVTCYDELYYLQESQDQVYYSEGIGTRAAILGVLNDWNVPVESYEGPDMTHSKLVYQSKKLSEIITDILEDAVKKGGEKCIIRSTEGRISILPRGRNNPVYHFSEENISSISNQISTAGMVTRVKVIGQENDDEKSSVEAVVDGDTQFGIRQSIHVRGKDASIEDAKNAANEILKEKGKVQKDITVESPDLPFIRKGDLVHVTAGTVDGYYFVGGIRHNADSGTMSMDLEAED